MTATSATREQQVEQAERLRHLALLTKTELGRRNRRPVDTVVLIVGAGVAALSTVIVSSAPKQDHEVAHALMTILGWAGGIWRAAFVALLVLALLIVADVLLRARWDLARDLLVTVVLLAGVATLLGGSVTSNWALVERHPLADWGYPDLRLALATAVLVVVGPELVRPVRLFAIWLVPLAAVGAIAFAAALPSAVLAALSLGLACGSLVRLAFGTAAGVPPTDDVRAALAALGVGVKDLSPALQQRIGSAEYVGHDTAGRPLKVRVLGRDAQDTQRLARRWRALAYRDPPRSVAVGRLEQVEHEALATLMAAQAGVRTPQVVAAALGPSGDAFVVTRQPDVEPLETLPGDQVSNELLEQLWQEVSRAQAAEISHNRLNASNVLVVDGTPMLVDWSAATLGAPQSALDIDVAELLVACTVLVGHERALAERDRRGVARRHREIAPVPPAGRADTAPTRSRPLARSRSEAAARRVGRGDRAGHARGRAPAPDPTEGPAADDGARVRRVPADQQARVDRIRNDCARAPPGGHRVGRRSPVARPNDVRPVGCLGPRRRHDPVAAPPLRRAAVGDQVRQPRRFRAPRAA